MEHWYGPMKRKLCMEWSKKVPWERTTEEKLAMFNGIFAWNHHLNLGMELLTGTLVWNCQIKPWYGTVECNQNGSLVWSNGFIKWNFDTKFFYGTVKCNLEKIPSQKYLSPGSLIPVFSKPGLWGLSQTVNIFTFCQLLTHIAQASIYRTKNCDRSLDN